MCSNTKFDYNSRHCYTILLINEYASELEDQILTIEKHLYSDKSLYRIAQSKESLRIYKSFSNESTNTRCLTVGQETYPASET